LINYLILGNLERDFGQVQKGSEPDLDISSSEMVWEAVAKIHTWSGVGTHHFVNVPGHSENVHKWSRQFLLDSRVVTFHSMDGLGCCC